MKVQNMTPRTGNAVPNQFILTGYRQFGSAKNLPMCTKALEIFQSYKTTIAERCDGDISLDRDMWDYSVTTSKYRNRFTGLTTKQTKAGIKDGSIQLVNLN